MNRKKIITFLDPDKKVDHEKDVEGQINLLSFVVCPGHTSLHCVTEKNKLRDFR